MYENLYIKYRHNIQYNKHDNCDKDTMCLIK